ncbi:response regulator [Mesorhizobium sp. BAC0120]|uniref:response regulator n=1 Tax=Mesorhizobium sp. BAC0120 TaxID=3090670 RepID=UPI00298BF4FA|nr:response regulator [Mesorhizobium sp. BAC0120]MDW6026519.1 response regulator [Mesorhizobium sp. BAC0120]
MIAEDEILALELEEMLTEMGHVVVDIATRIPQAIQLATEAGIDFAILDINVAGAKSFSIADVLRTKGVPFVFAAGYGWAGLIDGYRDEATLQKPHGSAGEKASIRMLGHWT